jgi:FAD/FMN-containing dehydrogenase
VQLAAPTLIHELRARFDGRVISADDDGYDSARSVFYGGIDRRPLAIISPDNATDVARAVSFARDAGLELAVRGGGHSLGGYGVSDGGIVVDLARLRSLEIDVGDRTAWAGGGLTTGEYSVAAVRHGLATGFGDAASVGIGGITLGGGVGYLVRKHGMTIDQLLAAEVVTADGRILRTDGSTNPDLFWAIRGGGGNFGVATRFRFRLLDVSGFVGGMLMLPATPDIIREFVDRAEAAPEELSTIANVMAAPPMPMVPAEYHGRIVLMAFMAWCGTADDGERAIVPFRELATPIVDTVRPSSYTDIFPPEQPGFHPIASVRNLFIDSIDTAAAERIIAALSASTAPMRVTQLRVLGGAMARVRADATAFAHRRRRMMVTVAAMHQEPSRVAEHDAWADALAESLQQAERGAYVNFMGEEDPARMREAYPDSTWDRLAAIKRRYDPHNLFRVNHNIPPA